MDGRTAEQWLKEWVEQEFAPEESPYQAITYLLDRIAELEAENKLLRKTEGHYIGCPLRVKLAAGIAPMCTPCTCNEIANKNAEAAAAELERVREPTEEMLVAARDWSYKKYGKPIGNEAAIGCWNAMLAAALKEGE